MEISLLESNKVLTLSHRATITAGASNLLNFYHFFSFTFSLPTIRLSLNPIKKVISLVDLEFLSEIFSIYSKYRKLKRI